MNIKTFISILNVYEHISYNIGFHNNMIFVQDEHKSCIFMCHVTSCSPSSKFQITPFESAIATIDSVRNALKNVSTDTIISISVDHNKITIHCNNNISTALCYIPCNYTVLPDFSMDAICVIPIKSYLEIFDILISHSIFSGLMEINIVNKELRFHSNCEIGSISSIKKLIDIHPSHIYKFGINIKYMRFITMLDMKKSITSINVRNNTLELCFEMNTDDIVIRVIFSDTER